MHAIDPSDSEKVSGVGPGPGSGRDVSLQLSPFGVVTGKCLHVLSDVPRWREVVVFANG